MRLWDLEQVPEKSRELLEAFKLIDIPAITFDPKLKGRVQDHILNAGFNDSYLGAASWLTEVLTDDGVVGLQAWNQRQQGQPVDGLW